MYYKICTRIRVKRKTVAWDSLQPARKEVLLRVGVSSGRGSVVYSVPKYTNEWHGKYSVPKYTNEWHRKYSVPKYTNEWHRKYSVPKYTNEWHGK